MYVITCSIETCERIWKNGGLLMLRERVAFEDLLKLQ
jgi:hypothetical protein